jgi:hypothetical protein
VVLSLFTCAATDPTASVTISGPTAIGIFPPVSQAELDNDKDGGLSSGIAHVSFALEDLAKCMAPRKLAVTFKHARAIALRDGQRTHELRFASDWQHAVAIVLVDPGKEPVVAYATAGPSSLQMIAPQEAWKYFSEPKCRRW